jgi:hypothetical protein
VWHRVPAGVLSLYVSHVSVMSYGVMAGRINGVAGAERSLSETEGGTAGSEAIARLSKYNLGKQVVDI